MLNFPIVDLSIAIIIILAVIIGLKRGFLKSLLSLGTFILSLLLAYFLTRGILAVSGNWLGIKAGALAVADAIFKLLIMIVLFGLFEIVFGFIERHIIINRIKGTPEAVSKLLGISVGFINAIILIIVALTFVVFLFPGENNVTAQIERSILGQFLFEKNPLPSFIATN